MEAITNQTRLRRTGCEKPAASVNFTTKTPVLLLFCQCNSERIESWQFGFTQHEVRMRHNEVAVRRYKARLDNLHRTPSVQSLRLESETRDSSQTRVSVFETCDLLATCDLQVLMLLYTKIVCRANYSTERMDCKNSVYSLDLFLAMWSYTK